MTTLYLVWRQPGLKWWPIGRLTRAAEGFAFAYTRGARAAQTAGFRPLAGFPEWDQVYVSATLFPVFANRLFPKRRPEYAQLQTWAELPASDPDPLVVLARTLGPRVTDMFEVFARPEPQADAGYSVIFFAHGLAHRTADERRQAVALAAGASLRIESDAANVADTQALRILAPDGTHVGFVPRYLCSDVHELRGRCADGSPQVQVRRVNPDAPPQFLLLCVLTACWPDGFAPCSQDEYQPLLPNADDVLAQLAVSRRAVV